MATGGPAPEKPFEMLDLGASSQVLRQVAADAAFDAPETQGETQGAAVLPAVPVAGMTTENLRSAVRLGGAFEAPGADSPDSGSVICERGRSLGSSWAPGTCVVATGGT